MSDSFQHNDLRFYVRAMWEKAGIDIRYMVPGFDEVEQATPETIENELESEDSKNANRMEHWLYWDRALEAVGMRQSDGYNKAKNAKGYGKDKDEKRNPKNAYIGLARSNAEKSKAHLYNVPISFEAVANFPERDAEAVKSLNFYRDEILNENNWNKVKEAVIDDGHDFGSGIFWSKYDPSNVGPDDLFFEERARQGQPIGWEEYQKFEQARNKHLIEHVDTFSVLRDRRASGEESMSFDNPCHTITTYMENISVTEAKQAYPDYEGTITPGISELYQRMNPSGCRYDDEDLMITRKHTWIKMPVAYNFEFEVDIGGGQTVTRNKYRQRTAVVHIERLHNCGIMTMDIDRYAHNRLPLTMWQRRPSKLHAYGIGAYKDMWAAEWAYNIAFNGKFRWFDRMAKGGGFYFSNVLDSDKIEKRTQEHAWVGIDPEQLPAGLRDRPISELVYDTRPSSFPSVYDNLELNAEDKVNRTSGISGVSGRPVGNSGRQQLIAKNNEDLGMQPTISNLEAAIKPLGVKFFSNIVQFDAEDEQGNPKPIEFMREDPETGERMRVELNKPVGVTDQYNPETNALELYAYEVKNNLKSLDFSTQISTRSIVPINPTEQRFFWEDKTSELFPLIEGGPKATLYLEMLDKRVYNGLFSDLVQQLKQVDQMQLQNQQQMAQREQQREDMEQAHDQRMDMIDRMQNMFRLKQKAKADMTKAEADLLKALEEMRRGNIEAIEQFTQTYLQGN